MRWHRGAVPPPNDADAQTLRLPVQIGEQWLDIPLMAVERFLDRPLIRPLPGSDTALLGYCNIDGQAVAVWQAAALVGQFEPAAASQRENTARYLLTRWGGSRVLAVDAVGRPYSELPSSERPSSERKGSPDPETSERLSRLKLDLPSRPQEPL